MKPGDLVRITRFDKIPFIGIYLGPSSKFDDRRQPYEGRFALNTGIIKDIDFDNKLVWDFEVLQ